MARKRAENAPISSDMEQLKALYANIDGNKRIYAEKMVKELVFMSETLGILQKQIREDGPINSYVNGNGFEVMQENPAQKSYNAMIKNYNSTIKVLESMLPKGEQQADELLSFLGGGIG